MTPYEVVYGPKPLSMASYVPSTSKVHAIDRMFHTKEEIICILKDNLFMAQNRMNQQVDHHISERSFNERNQVFLCLHPSKQTSLKDKVPQKLAPKFYGPYQIIQRIGHHLQDGSPNSLQDSYSISCVLFEEGCGIKFQSSEQPTRT